MTLASRLTALATRIGEEFVAVREEIPVIEYITAADYALIAPGVTGTLYIIIPE